MFTSVDIFNLKRTNFRKNILQILAPEGTIFKEYKVEANEVKREFTTIAFTIPDLYTSILTPKENNKAAVFKCDSCPSLSTAEATQPKRKAADELDSWTRSQSETSICAYPECTNCKAGDAQFGLPAFLKDIAYTCTCPPAGGPCSPPLPCGPCGCGTCCGNPTDCNCGCKLPPPCNTPPRCLQYMTGYYYYPYGTWFCGPYHVNTGAVPYPCSGVCDVKCCCGLLGCNLCFPSKEANQRQTQKDEGNVCSVCCPSNISTLNQYTQGCSVCNALKYACQTQLVENQNKEGKAKATPDITSNKQDKAATAPGTMYYRQSCAMTTPELTYYRQMAHNQYRGSNMRYPSQAPYQSQWPQYQYGLQQAQTYQNPFHGWKVQWDTPAQVQNQNQARTGTGNPIAPASPPPSKWIFKSQPRDKVECAAENPASFLSNTNVSQREAKISRRGDSSCLVQNPKDMDNRFFSKVDTAIYKEGMSKKDLIQYKEQIMKGTKEDRSNKGVKPLDFKNLSSLNPLDSPRVEEIDEKNLNKFLDIKKPEEQNVSNPNLNVKTADDRPIRSLGKLDIQKIQEEVRKAKPVLKDRPNYCEMLHDPKRK